MKDQQYYDRELMLFKREEEKREKTNRQCNTEALQEIKAIDQDEFSESILETCEWILAGHYGLGVLLAYEQLTERHNRKAWLFNTAVSIEFSCSIRVSCKAYHWLEDGHQDYINQCLDKYIKDYDKTGMIK